jgi:phenylpyruvate tautomerase PptA (4-oxalocrotonate tautomerase family)
MPITRIEARRSRSAEEVQELIEAVYLAQREALRVPEWDRQIRYVEHKPENFHVIPGTSENYVLIEVSMFAGRSMDAKRALYQRIVQRLAPLGIRGSDITIVVHEIAAENWGIRGGVPASEVDLGYEVNV